MSRILRDAEEKQKRRQWANGEEREARRANRRADSDSGLGSGR